MKLGQADKKCLLIPGLYPGASQEKKFSLSKPSYKNVRLSYILSLLFIFSSFSTSQANVIVDDYTSPFEFILEHNYPNLFNPITIIEYYCTVNISCYVNNLDIREMR